MDREAEQSKKEDTNWYAISALLISLFVFAMLVIFAIYAFNSANLRFPSRSASYTFFWVSIILAIIVFVFMLFSAWKIFTHKSNPEASRESAKKKEITPKSAPKEGNGSVRKLKPVKRT